MVIFYARFVRVCLLNASEEYIMSKVKTTIDRSIRGLYGNHVALFIAMVMSCGGYLSIMLTQRSTPTHNAGSYAKTCRCDAGP